MENKLLSAYPVPYQARTDGLTKKEYFAAHAPDEIPGWFKPVLPERPKPVDSPRQAFLYHQNEKWKELYSKYYDEENCVFADEQFGKKIEIPSELVLAVMEVEKKWNEWRGLEDEYHEICKIERFFQWRIFYAEKMASLTQ